MTSLPARSFLFVPGDDERKIEKSLGSGADALIFDLEDSVVTERKGIAREMVASALAAALQQRRQSIWVRINPASNPDCLRDLATIVREAPVGLMLPKADNPFEVIQLGHYLEMIEAREGLAIGTTLILAVVTETARASLSLPAYRHHRLTRLHGLTWGAEDLSADLGATSNVDDDGRLSFTYEMVRSLTLLTAKACGVEAIETIYPNYRDLEGLRNSCISSHREGFTGRLAIHPDQVDVINATFSPSGADIAVAEQVVAAFAAAPEAGVVSIGGKMLDRPHLIRAKKVLALRDAFASGEKTGNGG